MTQSIGAVPISIKEIQPDFLITACYKWLLGPYSTGLMYVNPKYHSGKPIEQNWITRKDSENFAGLVNYKSDYQKGARRFDVGERSNFALIPMVKTALEQLLEWNPVNINKTLRELINLIADKSNEIGLESVPLEFSGKHMMGIQFEGVSERLVQKLKNENIYISVRGNSIRISPHLYNSEDDILKLMDVLRTFK